MTIRQPARYVEKGCAECRGPFTPTSGRQRYCEFHRKPKFRTARDTESKQTRRATAGGELQSPRPPRHLIVEKDPRDTKHREWIGLNHRVTDSDRRAWVAQALRVARRLHRDGHLVESSQLVDWARRTAAVEVELVGCHHLGSLADDFEFRCYGPHAVSANATQGQSPTEANADTAASLPTAETPPVMSVSGVVQGDPMYRPGPDPINVTGTPGMTAGRAIELFLAALAEHAMTPTR
jgi:hypothetical protein